MKLGFIIFFIIYISLNFYIFLRGRQALPKDFLIQAIYTTLFVVLAFSFFLVIFLEGKISWVVIAIAENLGGFWLITLLYFLVMVLLGDVLRLTNHFFGIFPESITSGWARVKIMYFGVVVAILIILSVIGYIRFSNPQIVTLNLDIPARNSNIGKLTIVAVSDIHLGDVIRKSRLVKYVDLINRQQPDLILIAGDIFDRNLHSVERQHMDAELQKLKADYGVFAVLGNHEYFGNVNKAMEIISRSGITLLRDSAVNIDNRFIIIGRDDYTNRERKTISKIKSGVNANLPVILMDHQPVNLSETVQNNIDLQISGHTHNGQIYPMNKIVARIYELGYGYKKTANTHFYVSSGLGLWGAPIRLGTQSEIVKINLNFVKE